METIKTQEEKKVHGLKGRKLSEQHKLNMRKAKQRNPVWNKGIKWKWMSNYRKKHHPLKGRLREKSLGWRGGLTKVGGYYYLYHKELGTAFGGRYIKRANYNWYLKTGEIIKKPFFLHHIDGNRENDTFENLQKTTLGLHSSYHDNYTQIRNSLGRFVKKDKIHT